MVGPFFFLLTGWQEAMMVDMSSNGLIINKTAWLCEHVLYVPEEPGKKKRKKNGTIRSVVNILVLFWFLRVTWY